MLEFPNIQCSQNAVTAAGNLLISIHKMTTQTQIINEKQLIQDGKYKNKKYSNKINFFLFRIISFIN
jgi:hypothetical protein